MIRHMWHCLRAAARHPRIALMGAREFRLGCGMTYDDWKKSEAYDAGRELAHVATLRRFDEAETVGVTRSLSAFTDQHDPNHL